MSGSVGRPLLLLLQVLSVPSLPRDFSVHKLLPYSISGRRHVARGKVPVDGTSMSMVMIVPLQLLEFLLFVAPQCLGKKSALLLSSAQLRCGYYPVALVIVPLLASPYLHIVP